MLSLTLETDIRLKDSTAQTTTSDHTVIVLQRYSQSLEVTSDQPSDSEHGIRRPARRSNGKILLPVAVEQCREGLCMESWGTDDDERWRPRCESYDDVDDIFLSSLCRAQDDVAAAAAGTIDGREISLCDSLIPLSELPVSRRNSVLVLLV